MKKSFVGFISLFAVLSLQASMVSAISGPHFSDDDFKSKERGIIISKDIDGDGIDDSVDKCLDSTPCQNIGKDGCVQKEVVAQEPKVHLDSDKDGVINTLDKCPNTPSGMAVDANGCMLPVDLHVEFDTNKATIRNKDLEALRKFIENAQKAKGYQIVIEGYTDSDGSAKYNKALSKKRAKSVKTYILEHSSIDSKKIETIGYGEEKALNSNTTVKEKQANRRVVGVLKKIDGEIK